MGTHERRERQRTKLRQLIMDAARHLFATEGYQAVSMRRIADATEYSPAAIYVHFKDKQTLIRELCTQDFSKLAAQFVTLAKEKDPIERIRRLGHLYIHFAVEHPNHYRLMFMTPMDSEAMSDQETQGKGNPEEDAYAFLLHAVEEAMVGKQFAPGLKDAALVAQTFWAAVHGVASLQIAKGNDPWINWTDLEARSVAIIEASVRGMSRSPAVRRESTRKSKARIK